ncbi:hypothetical protein C8R43DRAFT_1130156 [Mycena crocata]|nr:hypothetical protein C8R43DRAFT_1130156 [Mycena crocata]
MQADLLRGPEGPEDEEGSGSPRKRGKMPNKNKTTVWVVNGEPPTAIRAPALCIVQLGLMAISHDHQLKLAHFLLAFPPDHCSSDGGGPTAVPAALLPFALERATPKADSLFVATIKKCALLENKIVEIDFELMMSYIQAALHLQCRFKAQKTSNRSETFASLAREIDSLDITKSKLEHWYQYGTRLMYLAASTSMYIVPMLAIAGMRVAICKTEQFDVIQRLAYLLCSPHASDHKHRLSRDCGDVVRKLVIPQMVFIHQVSTALTNTFYVDFPSDDGSVVAERIPFKEFDKMRDRLQAFDFSFWKLPALHDCWNALKTPLLAPVLPLSLDQFNITEDCVAPQVIIKTELKLKETVCPVYAENSFEWTKEERAKVASASVATSLSDLQEKLDDLHSGGDCADAYVVFPTEICDENVVTVRDADDSLIAMVIPNLARILPHLDDISLPLVSMIMEGEVYEVDSSDDPEFEFCATHKCIWNRYGQKGKGAPDGYHPNVLRPEGATHVNFTQRTPHPSDEMKEDPAETDSMAEFIKLITIIVEFHLKKYLPEEYAAITVYVERLPLNERSLAHPFGGFVINTNMETTGFKIKTAGQLAISLRKM